MGEKRSTKGGVRPGAGRRTLFPGKTEPRSIVMTDDAVAAADELAGYLSHRHGWKVSRSDAMCYGAIRTRDEIRSSRRYDHKRRKQVSA